MWRRSSRSRAMPEYMEVLFFRLVLMSLIVLGVSLLTNINTNERRMALEKGAHPESPGEPMVPNVNPRGTERDPDGFLGEKGALVMDVQHTGNLLGMLLRSTADGSYRVLTWTFRQGCALDWFPSGPPEENEKPNIYPAAYFQRFRSRMFFWFCFANLFGGGKEVVAQIDCTNNMNQADWNMYTVDGGFSFSRGWFETFTGNVSILDRPAVWMQLARADFERRVAEDPDLPAVIWMGDKLGGTVWKGVGFKSKSEILNRFWKNTSIGVFVSLGELKQKGPSGEDRLTDLLMATIMFLRSEAWVGKYYDLKTHDIQHNLKLWRHTYQVFDRAGMEECGPARKYEHDQIWADPLSIDPVQWERMARGRPRKWAGWVRSAKKADDKGTPWCPKLSAGSINYSIRYDYPYFEKHPEEALPESLTFLAPHRSTSVSEDSLAKAKPAPSLKKRRSIERQAKEEGRALKRARLDSELEPGEIKPYNPGPLDRREAVYGKRKKGQIQRNWRKYAVDLVQKLTEEGIQCIVGKEWVQSFKNMGSPS